MTPNAAAVEGVEPTWLERLKVGDEVIAKPSFGRATIRKVERVTATQVVVGTDRYYKATGRMLGSNGWDSAYIFEATPERVNEVRHDMLAEKLTKYQWFKLPLAALEAIWKAAEAARPKP